MQNETNNPNQAGIQQSSIGEISIEDIKEENQEEKKNWIDEMIIREATPKPLREGTNAEFCQRYEIPESNYYYYSSKAENKEKILQIALDNAKKHAPEVLENLGERAKENSQDAKLYLQFILQLAEKTDITSKGESIMYLPSEVLNKNVDISHNPKVSSE